MVASCKLSEGSWSNFGVIWEEFGHLFFVFSKFEGFCWMALPLERKPIFSGFGGPRSALLRLLFQVWIQGVCFNGVPVGSLWASLFRGIRDFVQDRFKSHLRGAKRVTFRRFGAPFGRILDDLLEDLACHLNTTFLGVP